MNILVSGLAEEACRDTVGTDPAAGESVRWCPPGEFMERLSREAGTTPHLRGVWLYQAPWTISMPAAAGGAGISQALAEWLRDNRSVLNARHRFNGTLLLANVDRVTPFDLRDALLQRRSIRPRNTPASAEVKRPALGKLFDWIAPQYWDVFEMLEAAAWIPDGEPLFRGLSSPTEEHLHALLQVLQDGHGAPHLRQELTEREQRLGEHGETLAEAKAELDRSAQVIAELQKLAADRETQLRTLAEERDEHARLAAQTSLELDRTTRAAAELQQLATEHATQAQRLREERDEQARLLAEARAERDRAARDASEKANGGSLLQAERDELKQENELLLIQLHQVQEELEQYYLKYTEQAKTVEAGKKAADEARQETTALRAQLEAMQEELQDAQLQLLERDAAQAESAAHANGSDVANTRLGRLLPRPARQIMVRARRRRALRDQCARIEQSGWFDRNWYLEAYPDVRGAGVDPVEHYFTVGWKENRNPCEAFDTAFYLRSNPDVRRSGVNPLWHFIEFGIQEGRPPRNS